MDLMIDLETMGVEPDAPVIAIGAVFFSRTGLGDDFYINIDLAEQIDTNRKVRADTIKWWMAQSNASQKVFKEQATPVRDGLLKFLDFLSASPQDELKVWGNGPSFDITIIEHLILSYGLAVPWKFWNVFDLRTFKRFVYNGKDMMRAGTYHNALDDAKYQAEIIIKGMEKKR